MVQSTLVLYSTSANLTVAYNLGATGGMVFGIQVLSGVIIAMSYVASDDYSFSTLDPTPTVPMVYGIDTPVGQWGKT